MSDQTKTLETRNSERAAWQRPEVRSLSAGTAEANPTGSTDLGALTS
jgi:hypothetical protein